MQSSTFAATPSLRALWIQRCTNHPTNLLKTLSPMGTISDAKDIADAVAYLTEARQVTGEVLHVDGGSHQGKW